jgi:hypothetical protein
VHHPLRLRKFDFARGGGEGGGRRRECKDKQQNEEKRETKGTKQERNGWLGGMGSLTPLRRGYIGEKYANPRKIGVE